MEIKGVVKAVLEVRSGVKKDGGQWSSQTVVLHIDGEYPKDVAIDLSGDNCGKCGDGDTVTAQCDVSSREWQGKWFTTVRAWKIDITEKAKEDLPFS
jgi:hypothetical protein